MNKIENKHGSTTVISNWELVVKAKLYAQYFEKKNNYPISSPNVFINHEKKYTFIIQS